MVVLPAEEKLFKTVQNTTFTAQNCCYRNTELADRTETVFSRLAKSPPTSTHLASELVLKPSQGGSGAAKPLDTNVTPERRSGQRAAAAFSYARLLRSPSPRTEESSGDFQLGRGVRGRAEQTASRWASERATAAPGWEARRGDGGLVRPRVPVPVFSPPFPAGRLSRQNGARPGRRPPATATQGGPAGGAAPPGPAAQPGSGPPPGPASPHRSPHS